MSRQLCRGRWRELPQPGPALRQRQLQIQPQKQCDGGGRISFRTWSESSRGINGTLEGRGGNGNFQVLASAAGFTRQHFLDHRAATGSPW